MSSRRPEAPRRAFCVVRAESRRAQENSNVICDVDAARATVFIASARGDLWGMARRSVHAHQYAPRCQRTVSTGAHRSKCRECGAASDRMFALTWLPAPNDDHVQKGSCLPSQHRPARASRTGSSPRQPRAGGVLQGAAHRAGSACGAEDSEGVHPRSGASRPCEASAAAGCDSWPSEARACAQNIGRHKTSQTIAGNRDRRHSVCSVLCSKRVGSRFSSVRSADL